MKNKKIIIGCKNPQPFPEKIEELNMFSNSIFNEKQIIVLKEALENNINLNKLTNKEYSAEKMKVLLNGLKNNIDLSEYINVEYYNHNQLNEILNGIKNHYEIEIILDNKIPAENMKLILEAKNEKIDLLKYSNLNHEILNELKEIIEINDEIEIDKFSIDYNKDQLQEIKKGIKNGIDYELYSWNAYSAEQMKYLRILLEKNKDVSDFLDPDIDLEILEKEIIKLFKK